MSLTDQQKAVVEHNDSAIVIAVAGSGKSFTIVQHAKKRPQKPALYLAFNRSVAIEAREKFRRSGCSHVTILTPHALAYHALDIKKNFIVAKEEIKPLDLIKILDFKTNRSKINSLSLAKCVLSCFNLYCSSSEKKISNINYQSKTKNSAVSYFVDRNIGEINRLASDLFLKMKNKELPITHDAYLKLYYLLNPKLDYDYIYADEGQDLSSVMLNIIRDQKCKKIIVGDPHQQLYSFRGAVNALTNFDYPRYSLTTSFRFNQDIADMGTRAIALKELIGKRDSNFELIGVSEEFDIPKTVALVARSNIALLDEAIASYDSGVRKLYFESGLKNHTFLSSGASLYDVVRLYIKKRERIENEAISAFGDFSELKEHAEEMDDKNLIMACKIADKYGSYLFEKIANLKKAEVSEKSEAEIIFGTVHRMKGLEFDHVELSSGFINEAVLLKELKPPSKNSKKIPRTIDELTEEINALYVAITRSRYSIDLPFFIEDCGDDLPPRNVAGIREAAVLKGAIGWRDICR